MLANLLRGGCCGCALVAIAAPAADVVINGAALAADKQRALEQAYRVPIKPGRYWYDAVSGVWGLEGGPALGQIHPNLALGPPLRADASHGNTRVFVNGRELHANDVLFGMVFDRRHEMEIFENLTAVKSRREARFL